MPHRNTSIETQGSRKGNSAQELPLLPSPESNNEKSKKRKKDPKPAPEGYQTVMDAFHKGLLALRKSETDPVYMNGRDGEAAKKLLKSMPVEKVLEGARVLFSLVQSKHKFYSARGFRTYVLESHYNEIMREKVPSIAIGRKSSWRQEQEEAGTI